MAWQRNWQDPISIQFDLSNFALTASYSTGYEILYLIAVFKFGIKQIMTRQSQLGMGHFHFSQNKLIVPIGGLIDLLGCRKH